MKFNIRSQGIFFLLKLQKAYFFAIAYSKKAFNFFPFTKVSAFEVTGILKNCLEKSDLRGHHFETVLGSQAVFI